MDSQQPTTTPWFADWFHTPYYDQLYASRNNHEAAAFIAQLVATLKLPHGASVLDIPCGSGRHSRALHAHGLRPTGLDINPVLIARARKQSPSGIHFKQHDLRQPYADAAFEAVFNLFTSFGYFDDDLDNHAVMQTFATALRPGGRLVIDFFNATHVQSMLPMEPELQTSAGVQFRIQRQKKGAFVQKTIEVQDGDKHHRFMERVRLLELADFNKYLSKVGLRPLVTYGDYTLQMPFDPVTSTRLVLVAEKPA